MRVALICVAVCSGGCTPTLPPPPPVPPIEADLLLAAMEVRASQHRTSYVLRELIVPLRPQTSHFTLGPENWTEIPEELRTGLTNLAEDEVNAWLVDPGDRLEVLTQAEVDRMSRELIVFYHAFSPPVVSPDGLEALVYYELRCGGVCGEGGALWFSRTNDGVWSLSVQSVLWIG